MFLRLSYKTTSRVGARLQKTLAVALILSLCVFAFVAREARAVESLQEKPQQQRSAEKPKLAKSGAEATSTAGTTSAEARPAEISSAEPPPETAEPTPEAPLAPEPVPEPVTFEPAPEAAPPAPEPVYEPVAFEPTPEALPPAPVPATLAAEPAAFEPAPDPTLQPELVGAYDDAGAPVDPYPAEDSGVVPAQGLGAEPEEQYPAMADERIAEPVGGAAPAGAPVDEKPLAGASPVEPAPADVPPKPASAPALLEKDKPAPARTGETLKPISLVPSKPAPARAGEIPAPKPVAPVPRREEPRPVPAGPTAVKTLRNAANALGQLANGALFRPVTVEVDLGSTGAALAGLFSGAQAALTPADDYAGDPEPPSGGTGAPSGDGTSQRPHAPFTLPPLGSSSFSLLPGGGEFGPGSAGSLLLLGVLASGLVLLRWNGRLYRAWWEPPRLNSLFLQALERPG